MADSVDEGTLGYYLLYRRSISETKAVASVFESDSRSMCL